MTNVRSIAVLLKSFDDYLQSISWDKKPFSLYQPIDYILSLGGKRIRPVSHMFITDLLKGPTDAALHAAYALELFHNFSLIHDDIMDQAELRRSSQTVHKKYGLNAAILSGDVMMIEALRYIMQAESASGCRSLQNVFIETARIVCEGQAMDMDFEVQQCVTYNEYLEMVRLKTAALLAAAFKMAALISGRDDLADSLYSIGQYTGIAFQLEDDWLDFYAEDKVSGKVKGGDIIRSKKSALILEFMEQLDDQQQREFVEWYNQPQKSDLKLERMENHFAQYDTNRRLRQRINFYHNKAYDDLASMAIDDDQRKSLRIFVEGIFSRTS